MTDALSLHATALGEFYRRVHAVRPDQWGDPTPATAWDVRALVNHLVVEQLWVPLLLDGATVQDVGTGSTATSSATTLSPRGPTRPLALAPR